MDYKSLSAELSKNIISDAYLFVVEDEYIANSYVRLFRTKLTGDTPELNYSVFDTKKLDPVAISETLEALPFMAEKRVVLIKANEIRADDPLARCLIKYLENPSPYTALIVYTKSIKASTKLYKIFESNYKIVEFKRLSPRETEDWVRNTFAKHGMKIRNDAVRYFLNATDYNSRESNIDLGSLAGEINKVAIAYPGRKDITLEMIKNVISVNVSDDMFKYCDCLVTKNLGGAFIQLDRLLYGKVSTQLILSRVHSTMRDRASYLYLTHFGKSRNEILAEYKVAPYTLKKITELKGLSEYEALDAIRIVYETDRAIKSGQMRDKAALYTMTERICHIDNDRY